MTELECLLFEFQNHIRSFSLDPLIKLNHKIGAHQKRK